MKTNHYVTLGMLLGAVALMIGGLDHWGDALKPSFVAGVLGAVGTVFRAMYQAVPADPDTAAIVRASRGE